MPLLRLRHSPNQPRNTAVLVHILVDHLVAASSHYLQYRFRLPMGVAEPGTILQSLAKMVDSLVGFTLYTTQIPESVMDVGVPRILGQCLLELKRGLVIVCRVNILPTV